MENAACSFSCILKDDATKKDKKKEGITMSRAEISLIPVGSELHCALRKDFIQRLSLTLVSIQ